MTLFVSYSYRFAFCRSFLAAALLANPATGVFAGIQTATSHQEEGTAEFTSGAVPAPSKNDAATVASFSIMEGQVDPNSGGIETLHDGKLPSGADEPDANFFFAVGTTRGRVLVDLTRIVEIRQINTYSWHPSARGPQMYQVYASDGAAQGFNAQPKQSDDLEKSGWKFVARVDTRARGGGQHGVSVFEPDGIIGKYRYLLFDIERTEDQDRFANTFYSEIDVVEKGTPVEPILAAGTPPLVIKSADGACEIAIDTSQAADLSAWAEQKLAPVLAAWYPKIVAMLPSDGFEPPKRFSVVIRPEKGVAATSGTRITANSDWLKSELNGEALGALVHEVVHVLQQYRGGRRNNPDAVRPPGWLVEGIPDYIRWFLYEPESHGADFVWLRAQRNPSLHYDGGYRISANFLNYVVEHHDSQRQLIRKLNAACRQSKSTDPLWQECTGKPLPELVEAWKAAAQQQLKAPAPAAPK